MAASARRWRIIVAAASARRSDRDKSRAAAIMCGRRPNLPIPSHHSKCHATKSPLDAGFLLVFSAADFASLL
jgi:hypothetical protein